MTDHGRSRKPIPRAAVPLIVLSLLATAGGIIWGLTRLPWAEFWAEIVMGFTPLL